MFGAIFSNPSATILSYPNHKSLKALKLRASLPPASKIFVRSVSLHHFLTSSAKSNASNHDRSILKDISYSTNESSLRKDFSDFGQIVEVKLAKDEGTKRSKGYAFVQYTSQEAAMLAIEQMDSKCLDGRTIYVELAKARPDIFGAYPITSGPPTEKNS
ncbi:small RNA-binding protein 11, chloroplastic-like isoform X1 [Tasmannia lanceolata]|uniref:small RNA-binding protein 11, chloroplastic-like isoform X1 n=1 Tax=Tasmannia lanceolata TaxID=3420 RepID=UPI00406431DD